VKETVVEQVEVTSVVKETVVETVVEEQPAVVDGKVLGLHTIELRPGVKAEDFEKFVIEEFYPLPHYEGWKRYIAKGDRGEREGKYVLVFSRFAIVLFQAKVGTQRRRDRLRHLTQKSIRNFLRSGRLLWLETSIPTMSWWASRHACILGLRGRRTAGALPHIALMDNHFHGL
jgi:hypothetical protein